MAGRRCPGSAALCGQFLTSSISSLSPESGNTLGHALEYGKLTITEFQAFYPQTSRRTLQRDLRALVEKGLILRRGSTNRIEYIPANGTA